jgi:DNA polymerase III delta subunit
MASENALGFLRAADREAPAVALIAGPQEFLREYVLDLLRERAARDGFGARSFQIAGGDGFGAAVAELESADLFAPRRFVAGRVMRAYRERASDGDGEEASEASGGRAGRAGGEAALGAALERISANVRAAILYERDTMPAKLKRVVEKLGLTINCPRPFDNQLGQYAELFARRIGLRLAPDAIDLLVGRHGADLSGIANALARAAIHAEKGGRIDGSALGEAAGRRAPEPFELAESIARGRGAEAVAIFDRAVASGRDPIELLGVEIIPTMRRILAAASILEQRKNAAEVAHVLGLPPSSPLVTRAIDGARRFGAQRLFAAHRRACQLDAGFKNGTLREREAAIGGLLLELGA